MQFPVVKNGSKECVTILCVCFLCAVLHTVNALLSSFPTGFHRFPAFPPPGQPLSAREAAGRLLLLCVAVRERQLEDATGSRGVQRGNRPAHDKGH